MSYLVQAFEARGEPLAMRYFGKLTHARGTFWWMREKIERGQWQGTAVATLRLVDMADGQVLESWHPGAHNGASPDGDMNRTARDGST